MTESEIKQGFGSITRGHPFWKALDEALEAFSLEEITNLCNPKLTDAERHFNAGRLARSEDTLNAIRGIMDEVQRSNVQEVHEYR